MVGHVFQQIQILQSLPAFVNKDLQVHIVILACKVIHVQVIRVKHVVIVHYQQEIHHIHVYVKRIIRVVNVKEVKKQNNLFFIFDLIYLANPCLSSPCLNQGICQSSWNTTNTWFICLCVGTYTGTRCQTSLFNQCGGLCMNG
jgi:hypothetical protein